MIRDIAQGQTDSLVLAELAKGSQVKKKGRLM